MDNEKRNIEYEWIEYAQYRCTRCGWTRPMMQQDADEQAAQLEAETHTCPEQPQNAV
jgi:hypothetical protein